jgi:hypothetical protein
MSEAREFKPKLTKEEMLEAFYLLGKKEAVQKHIGVASRTFYKLLDHFELRENQCTWIRRIHNLYTKQPKLSVEDLYGEIYELWPEASYNITTLQARSIWENIKRVRKANASNS